MEQWRSGKASGYLHLLLSAMMKDGGVRLCVDYRKLNRITKFDIYPTHTIEKLLGSTANAYFSAILDLAKKILPGTHESEIHLPGPNV